MNHVLFWNCMAKNGTALDPKGALIKAIDKVSRFAIAGAIDRASHGQQAGWPHWQQTASHLRPQPAYARHAFVNCSRVTHTSGVYGKSAYALAPVAYTRIVQAH